MPKLDKAIGPTARWTVLQDLRGYGLQTIVNATASQIVPEREQLIGTDTIVLAAGVTPPHSLYEELRGRVEGLHVIGAAKELRKAYDAMHEGFEVRMELQTPRLRMGVAFSTMSARCGVASEKERRT